MEQDEQRGRADIVVTRVVDASMQRAWQAWVDPDDVMRWWGPTGFSAPVADMDVREGGVSLVAMRSPDGHDLWNTWTYSVVRPGERLEFVMSFADVQGRRITPAEAGLPAEIPDGVHHVVDFRAEDEDRISVTVTEHGYEPGPIRDMSQAGQEQVMDKYVEVVSG
ncbi:MAG: SRPBCC family protein [Jiangellaceae bacterium]